MAVPAGDGSVNEATMTRMQELGSAWVFKRAIQDNEPFNRWEDIRNDDDTFDQIKDIWKEVGGVNWSDEVDREWLINFYKQHEVLLPKIGNAKFTEFSRDGGPGPKYILPGSNSGETFMEWVSKYVAREFKIGQKDSWNPADIWLIQDEKKWKDKIKAAFNKRKNTKESNEVQLAKFNAIFRALFRTKQIMGISLKKIGKTATFKEVNVSGKFLKKVELTQMTLKSAKSKLGTKKITEEQIAKAKARGKKNPRTGSLETPLGKAGAATLESQDTILRIEDNGLISGQRQIYKIQIKANNSTGFSNLKWEPTLEDKPSARMGKATVALVLDLMKGAGMMHNYEPDNKAFPKDQSGFSGKVVTQYKKILKEMMAANFADFGPGVDAETAIVNIRETFNIYRSQPWVASSKLQQIRFLYALFKIPDIEKRNNFLTSLVFAAAKEGRRYGPYGKIY